VVLVLHRVALLAAVPVLAAACSAGIPADRGSAVHEVVTLPVHRTLALPPYPRDLVATQDAPCARVPLPAGWVARENALPGTRDWRPTPRGSAQLYVEDPSLACGDRLTVRVGGTGTHDVRVRVLRVGWYGGAGAREVWRSTPLAVPRTGEPPVRDHVVPDAAWADTVRTQVTPAWTPGLYLAETVVGRRATGAAGFVVRNDATPSPLVAVQSNLTWAAYSEAGGASLYRGPVPHGATHAQQVAARAYRVSLLRPTAGAGLEKLLEDDVPLAHLTDRLGLPVDHVLDTDLELRPSVLRGYAGVVLPGHAEYWTRRAYDALQAVEAAGTNVADLGANSLYWQARVAHDRSGRPLDVTVYRTAALDPVAATAPALTTVRWQDRALARPSSAVVGEAYAAAFVRGGLVLHQPPAWLVAGSPARDGTVLPDAVLNEADGARATDAFAPVTVQAVAVGVLRGTPDVVVSTSYASLPSGAAAFDAGSTTWLCAVEDSCREGAVPGPTSRVLLRLLANVLHAFGHPRWGATHPARADVPASAASLLRWLPMEAVGWHGRGD
jgi:hypothetical protein